MGQARRGDAGVEHPAAANVVARQYGIEVLAVGGSLGEQARARSTQPAVDCGQRLGGGGGLTPDARLGHHRDELVHDAPGQRPGPAALQESAERLVGLVVSVSIRPERVHEQVRVEGDQRPSP